MNSRKYPLIVVIVSLALLCGLIGLITHARNSHPVSSLTEVTTENFEDQVMNSPLPVFIEFTASKGCKPCEEQAPAIEAIAKEYNGKLRFLSVDVTKTPEIAAALGIDAVPTHLVIKPKEKTLVGGQGVLSQDKLRQLIEAGLKAQPKKTDGSKPDANAPSDDQPSITKPDTDTNSPADKTQGMPNPAQPLARPLHSR